MTHSVFIREHAGSARRPPQLLAYDIANAYEADRLVQGIAMSYLVHGENPVTGCRWFRTGDRTYDIYCWEH